MGVSKYNTLYLCNNSIVIFTRTKEWKLLGVVSEMCLQQEMYLLYNI